MSATINLEGVVNIAKVEAIHHEMEEFLKQALPTTINASDVSRADTAALQLLASFMKSMALADVTVVWAGASEELKEAASLLGLEQTLKLSSAV